MSDPQWQLETLAVHGGYRPDPTTRAVAVPIYQTVAYAFDDTQHGADLFDLKVPGNIYTRIMNPTTDVLEQRLAALEGGIGALALASGQAAITYALQTIAEAGDNIVASSALYGGSLNLLAHTLPQYGIQARFADPADPSAFAALIDERTKAVFVESIGNPRGNVTDIAAIAEVAHAAGVPLIVDNTVATPFLLRPFEHGADIVVHSLTKYLAATAPAWAARSSIRAASTGPHSPNASRGSTSPTPATMAWSIPKPWGQRPTSARAWCRCAIPALRCRRSMRS